MKIEKLPNGNLAMSCNNEEQIEIAKMLTNSKVAAANETAFILGYVLAAGYPYRPIKPEVFRGLTEATCITDGKDVWGDMDYQIHNFLETLADGETVIWTRG